MIYSTFLFWLIILIILSYFLDCLWSRLFGSKSYRFFITPGIIIHELSHALACWVTLAKIKRIVFFAPEGGFVEHTKPKIPLGNLVVSLAPLFGTSLALFALAHFFGYQENFYTLDFSLSFFANINHLFGGILDLFQNNFRSASFWVFVYLVASVSTAIAPSKVDLKHAFWGTIFLFIVIYLVLHYKGSIPLLETIISENLGWVVSLGVVMELIAMVVTLPFWIVKKFF